MDRSQTYQIKSTPFIRRMVSTSTKNGELQRLKQEYERIKNFNERTIEKQMRHARLRRLYRVIEIIKESQPERARARAKTEEHLRAEQIVKARQLGMEFSRRNAVQMEQQTARPASVQRTEQLKFRFEPHNPTEEAARRKRSFRRLAYGNESSRKNREQIAQGATKRVTISQHEIPDPAEEKRQLLFKRIKYGNERSTHNLVQLQSLKNTTHEQHSDIAQLRWLDSINRSNVTDWCSSAPTTALSEENVEESIAASAERQESEHHIKSALSTQVLNVNQIPAEIEATLTPEMTERDNSLELAPTMCSPQADSTLQQVGRYVLDALKRPFALSKSKSTASDFQQLENILPSENPIEHYKAERRRASSVGCVQVEDVTDEDNEQSELHQVSNSTNLQSLYTHVKISDVESSTSEFIYPPSSVDDTMTPDELVLSCQHYMDNISDDERRHRRSGKYDSNILNPYEKKIMDVRAKLVEPISTEAMDKEQLSTLSKVRKLRAIFEN